MSNEQMNIVSIPTVSPVAQLVTQGTTVPDVGTKDGMRSNGGVFDELLRGIQRDPKVKDVTDSGQAELQSKGDNDLIALEAVMTESVVDLLELLQVSPQIIPAHETVAPNQMNAVNKDVRSEEVRQGSEISDVASQIALAAYFQPGRMPEVNTIIPLPVDQLQKVAPLAEQPAVTAAPVVSVHVEQPSVELIQTPLVLKSSEPEAAQSVALPEAEQHVQTDVNRSVGVNKQPVIHLVPTVTAEPTQIKSVQPKALTEVTTPIIEATIEAPAPSITLQPERSDRMSEVNKPTQFSAAELQKVVTVTEQPVIIFAEHANKQVERTAAEEVRITAPLQVSASSLSVEIESVPTPDRLIAKQGEGISTPVEAASEKTAAASLVIQAERSLDVPIVPVPSPESLLEIQLSQPRPITARVTTTAGLADNHPAVLVQEIRDTRQRSNSGQNVVKEMASSIQIEESARESKLGPVSSYDGGNNAEQSDFTSDNQMLSQDFRGQLRVEQQIITASTAKPVTTEPVRQDVPEQVVLQVKERLAQHDLKSGNQQIRLILSPDNLGELKVNLNLQGQKLSVEIVTENRTVRDAIVLHTEALKESLARQNITMESFDVTTGGNNSEKQGQNQNAWRELAKQQQQQQFLASSRGYHVAQADLSSGQKVFQRQQGDSMLDIHY